MLRRRRTRPSLYTFDAFHEDAKARVRRLHDRLHDPGASWPGVLLLDLPGGGLSAEPFEISGLNEREKHVLATVRLPAAIRTQGARRFCWVMPVWRRVDGSAPRESLLLVLGERGRCEVVHAGITRSSYRPPELGDWNDGPFGPASRRVAGLWVDPLLAAFEPEQE